MTDSIATLSHQIGSASDLQSVVRTMRAVAASSIHQYEQSVLALADYRNTVNLGLAACMRLADVPAPIPRPASRPTGTLGAIVFGSDQGLVGQFNELVVEHALNVLQKLPGPQVFWAVGERVTARLEDAGIAVESAYPVPSSVAAIAQLVDRLQFDTETHPSQRALPHIHIFYNRPHSGALYEPVDERLLPLDKTWRDKLRMQTWPTPMRPQLMGPSVSTLQLLIREHLFISLYRASAESLASENASRLAAMERADKNIEELLTSLRNKLHSQRQSSIDAELSDVLAGYEALAAKVHR
ncbi:MAG: F0F1 ATP synthase subunit gamma [Rhodoferax sp.]|uniref:F0F1 ATP synthase subunit gamma n=1 Tax=Rhodoferax sp. TaxID=50421 RepID=UPI00326415A6